MTTCPACSAPEFDGNTCKRCGYAAGEQNRCPHCGAVARAESKGEDRWVCAICGGPRIPGGHGGKAAAGALAKEKNAIARARVQSFATVFLAIVTGLFTLLGLAILPASIVGKLIFLALAIVPLALALRARSRASRARKDARAAHEEAWLTAAEEIARSAKNGITAAELGKMLAIPPKDADRMLTDLAARDKARIDVDDDAAVRYRIGQDDSDVVDEEFTASTEEEKEKTS